MQISAAAIMAATAEYFETSLDELRGPGKTRALAQSRQIAMYLCRELTDLSLPKIGQAFLVIDPASGRARYGEAMYGAELRFTGVGRPS